MNKRGQFYLITVFILAIAIFGLSTDENEVNEVILFEDFSKLSNNYIIESQRLINYALYKQSPDVSIELSEFTKKFLEQSRQKNKNVDLLYIFSDGSNIKITNYMSEPVIAGANFNIPGAQEEIIESATVQVGGLSFFHQIPLKVQDFGQSWYEGDGSPIGNEIDLSVSGFVHKFDISPSAPEFKVLLKSSTRGVLEQTIGGTPDQELEILFSQDSSDEEVIQVYEEK